MVLITQTTSEGSGEPAHPCSLDRAFAVHTHKVWKQTKGRTKNQTSSPTGWLHMNIWRKSFRRTKSAIILKAVSFPDRTSDPGSSSSFILCISHLIITSAKSTAIFRWSIVAYNRWNYKTVDRSHVFFTITSKSSFIRTDILRRSTKYF